MKTMTAAMLAIAATLAANTHAMAFDGYTGPIGLEGTHDALRLQAGYQTMINGGRPAARIEPLGTTDAVREQAGRRASINVLRVARHVEPAGTTDAFRQRAEREIANRSTERMFRFVASNLGN